MTESWLDRSRALRTIAAALLLFAVAGCAPAKVNPVQSYQGPPLPRPGMVIVTDFTTPDSVTLDHGLGARLRNAVGGTTDAARQSDDERKVVDAIANALVKEIQARGLPATRSNQLPPPSDIDALVVGGRILSIDEGNRTRRNVIGLGAGQSSVEAHTEVYYVPRRSSSRLVESYDTNAESSRKPGAAETLGVGAATGRIAESVAATGATGVAPALSGDVEADGTRMGQAIAKRLNGLFTSQGWTH